MKLEKAIEILERHQLWMTGEYDDYYYEPKLLHNAIDIVISQLSKKPKLKSNNEISSIIKEIRTGKSITQVWVAKKLGMGQPEYSKLENGHRKKFDVEMLNKLCEIFEVSMNQFTI